MSKIPVQGNGMAAIPKSKNVSEGQKECVKVVTERVCVCVCVCVCACVCACVCLRDRGGLLGIREI